MVAKLVENYVNELTTFYNLLYSHKRAYLKATHKLYKILGKNLRKQNNLTVMSIKYI